MRGRGREASLAMMATLGFLWGGACFGFNGIKTVFLDEGLFADACDHGDRCKAQINQVDAAWTFASAMLNVMALVNGSLSDALGLRRLCLLSSALLAISTGAFYLVVTRRRYEQYLSYVYFALVESGMLLCCLPVIAPAGLLYALNKFCVKPLCKGCRTGNCFKECCPKECADMCAGCFAPFNACKGGNYKGFFHVPRALLFSIRAAERILAKC